VVCLCTPQYSWYFFIPEAFLLPCPFPPGSSHIHFVRPHESLRIALMQPRERGGRLLAQRYRQRTPAMVAGRTNRRWNEVGGRRVALRYVFNRPFPNEVGHRRGAFQPFSVAPFPNDTGKFPCMSLSRATSQSKRDSERTYTLRGLSTPCSSAMFLLPLFALWTTFSSSLVGRHSHD
jgi:hypothetical protein